MSADVAEERTGDTAPDGEVVDYEALFRQAPCGYVVTDDDDIVVTVNDTFCDWTGHDGAELVGRRFASLLAVGDRILHATHTIPQLRLMGVAGEVSVDVVGADATRHAALLTADRTPPTDTAEGHVRIVVFSAHERRLYERNLLEAKRRAEESDARRAEVEADLRHRVRHDPLTGLANRTGLMDRIGPSIHVGAGSEVVAWLFVDLDEFKLVNESVGQAAGDELLRTVAERLRSSAPEGSLVARLSGDEFVVVVRSCSVEEVAPVVAHLLDRLQPPVLLDGIEIVPSASIGVTVAGPGDHDVQQLLRQADQAMQHAKRRGRNRWERFDPDQPDLTAHRLQLLEELRRAVAGGELRLHFQPQVDLRTGRLHSAEALIRWQHPTRGLLAPASFLDAAEESGLIREIGAWVIDAAVGQVASWRATTGRAIAVSANVSARQLADANLVAIVTDALARHRVDPHLLRLEVTETALMIDPDAALEDLEAVGRLGVGLAVDDFGTGYSSLTYLKRFPVDELKIDRSFVAGMDCDDGDRTIVESCIQLAHAFGIHCVAEGVETDSQRRILAELGCDLAQGFWYSRPCPADELTDWSC